MSEPNQIDMMSEEELRQDLRDLVECNIFLRNENAELKAENEALSKKATQRGARMQLMRAFILDRPNPPKELMGRWFDKDGAPL